MSDATESSEKWVEIPLTPDVKAFMAALRALSWRIIKWIAVAFVFIGIPIVSTAYYMGWFGFDDVDSSSRTAFLFGIVDLALLLVFFYGTRWIALHRRDKVRLSRRTDTD